MFFCNKIRKQYSTNIDLNEANLSRNTGWKSIKKSIIKLLKQTKLLSEKALVEELTICNIHSQSVRLLIKCKHLKLEI